MKSLIYKIIYILQIHKILKWLNRNKVVILMYHGFTDKSHFDGIDNYHKQNLDRSIFKKHLEYLKRNHNVISLESYVNAVNQKMRIPPRSVIITIDDGYKSNYLHRECRHRKDYYLKQFDSMGCNHSLFFDMRKQCRFLSEPNYSQKYYLSL